MLKAEVRDGVLATLSGSGNVVGNAADIGVIVAAVYHALRLQDEQAAEAFRVLVKDALSDDSPVWAEEWRAAAFEGIAVVMAHFGMEGD